MNVPNSELDDRIAILRNNIADLTEQAAGAAGSAAEESVAARIETQQAMLDDLLKQREALDSKDD